MAKVLLADDCEVQRELLAGRLAQHGYEVIAVADGREAVLAAREHRPDLVLMDLEMPVLNGWAAARVLKKDPRTCQIPVICVTSYSTSDDVYEAVAAGCMGYETKPVMMRRLLRRIEELLALR